MNILLSSLTTHKYLKAFFITIGILGVFLLLVWARRLYGSMHTFREGESFLKKGQDLRAVTFFDRSLHWYTPFNPYISKSAEGLWEISQRAEAKGDIRLALIAVRTLRRGFIAARSFYTPGKDWIKRCDERLHELLNIQLKRHAEPKNNEISKKSILDDPQVRGPDVFWSIILLAGLLGWIGAAVGFIISGFGPSWKARLFRPANLKWIVLWAVSFLIWILGMIKA